MTQLDDLIASRILKIRGWTETDVSDMEDDGVVDAFSLVKDDMTLMCLPTVGDNVLMFEVYAYIDGVCQNQWACTVRKD